MAAKKKVAKKPKGGGARRKPAKLTRADKVDVNNDGVQLLLGNMIAEKDREYYCTTYLGLMAKKAHIGSQIQEFGKKCKEAGVDLPAMKLALSMEKWDPLELATYLKQQAAFMRDRGLPVQLALYEPKYGSIEKQAQALGWQAGRAGRSPDTAMFPENTPGHVEYMRSWNDGQAELGKNGILKVEDPEEDAVEEE